MDPQQPMELGRGLRFAASRPRKNPALFPAAWADLAQILNRPPRPVGAWPDFDVIGKNNGPSKCQFHDFRGPQTRRCDRRERAAPSKRLSPAAWTGRTGVVLAHFSLQRWVTHEQSCGPRANQNGVLALVDRIVALSVVDRSFRTWPEKDALI